MNTQDLWSKLSKTKRAIIALKADQKLHPEVFQMIDAGGPHGFCMALRILDATYRIGDAEVFQHEADVSGFARKLDKLITEFLSKNTEEDFLFERLFAYISSM